MGFTDPAPHAEDPAAKQLYVAFKHKVGLLEAPCCTNFLNCAAAAAAAADDDDDDDDDDDE
eukprot:1146135-Pelagomonas_calceolata.AAC.17